MYEIFESQVDNIEISREYNYLRNYKIEEINNFSESIKVSKYQAK